MVRRKKDLEKELKKYNIPFWKAFDKRNKHVGYYLWCLPGAYGWRRDEYSSFRKCWRLISEYDRSANHRSDLKKFSNKQERAKLRDNLANEKYERAEVRDGKADRWSYD